MVNSFVGQLAQLEKKCVATFNHRKSLFPTLSRLDKASFFFNKNK